MLPVKSPPKRIAIVVGGGPGEGGDGVVVLPLLPPQAVSSRPPAKRIRVRIRRILTPGMAPVFATGATRGN